ncbi:MAG: tRNA (guanosine(37)-N1)-methyltransferase TrmD [Deltaproteobacteria bacterium]|nr:tRNA (guanosine(37)-N1)-methyltransferase TrmD [Deltaproteobacteria bacterium]
MIHQIDENKKVIDVISIMPEYFESFLKVGLIERALKTGLIEINIINPRDFSEDKHKRVDDKIYGGGAGQLLMAEPILKAYEYSLTNYKYKNKKHITVIMSASGKLLDSSIAEDMSDYSHIIIICGRYEGIDARVTDITGGVEVSIGNYILSGGEIAAIVFIEAVGRYFKGFLGNPDSLKEESLSGNFGKILEYPQYTKPKILKGKPVPNVLLGGNHKLINEWRTEKALKKTAENRGKTE